MIVIGPSYPSRRSRSAAAFPAAPAPTIATDSGPPALRRTGGESASPTKMRSPRRSTRKQEIEFSAGAPTDQHHRLVVRMPEYYATFRQRGRQRPIGRQIGSFELVRSTHKILPPCTVLWVTHLAGRINPVRVYLHVHAHDDAHVYDASFQGG
jgi:hypothetical protein